MINPSQAGRNLILDLVANGDELLRLASTGTHMLNPYHNLDHELSIVYWSYACAINSESLRVNSEDTDDVIPLDGLELVELLVNGLFHDHNHSGGKCDDKLNIARAAEFLRGNSVFYLLKNTGVHYSRMLANLECTEFSAGAFTYEPKTFAQKCARDADLMSIYTQEGRNSLVGLFEEMNINIHDRETREVALMRNAAFLNSAPMYTAFGRQMKAQHLERSVKAFNEMVNGWFDPPHSLSMINAHDDLRIPTR